MKNTDWFMKARWGVMTHFLARLPGPAKDDRIVSADQWNRQVDSVDVEAMAAFLAEIGAGYYLLTIGQNSGHFCSPNATYDELTGIEPSQCSRRDLISDMADALAPYDIPLLAYLPAHPPYGDKRVAEALEYDPWWHDDKRRRPTTDPRLAGLQRKWEAIIREWSLRWGDKVRGWWIDGVYRPEIYDSPVEPNFRSFAAALKAGNSRSIVAFNPGIMWPLKHHTEHEDYLAGEVDGALFAGYWGEGGYHEPDRWYEGVQLHVLTFLGTMWNQGDAPRFPDELVIGYTKFINSRGGAVTWDVPIEPDCHIREGFIPQLRSLGAAIKRT